jgi:flagellar motor protein MotB
VAGNDSAGGRQMNRRVEIVLSAEDGSIAPR